MDNFLFLSLFWLPLEHLCIMRPKFLNILAGEYRLIFSTVLIAFSQAFRLILLVRINDANNNNNNRYCNFLYTMTP